LRAIVPGSQFCESGKLSQGRPAALTTAHDDSVEAFAAR